MLCATPGAKKYEVRINMVSTVINTVTPFFSSYMELEKYEEAVRDYEKVCKMDRSRGKVWPGFLKA